MASKGILKSLALYTILQFLLFLPLTTQAQGTQYDTFPNPDISSGFVKPSAGTGFIPCSGTTCSPCHLVVLFNTVLKWFLTIAFLIFAIVALVAGIKLVTQGNPGALADAKKSFLNAFIGLIIILSAFLIVDTLMRYLVREGGNIQGYGPWQEVKCAEQTEAKITEGFFKGDAPYVPGQAMSNYSGTTYTGGSLPLCTNSFCSVAALQSAGFTPSQARVMSCISITESSGNPLNPPYNTLHPESKSSACGLFSIVRSTWNGTAVGACSNFSQCTNAPCNTQTALKLVRSYGYQPWTCNGCNSKAEGCIRQYQ